MAKKPSAPKTPAKRKAQVLARSELTARQVRAAQRVALDQLSDSAIAGEAGVSRQTLFTWKQRPDFQEAVAKHAGEIEAGCAHLAIASRANRIALLNSQRQAVLEEIEHRRRKRLAKPRRGHETPGLEKADVELMAELRAIDMQAAKELGQHITRLDATTNGKDLQSDTITLIGLGGLSDEELEQRIASLSGREASKALPS